MVKLNHVLRAEQFLDTNCQEAIFQEALRLKKISSTENGALSLRKELEGKNITLFFGEPSSRTRGSFETAGKKLGANTVLIEGAFYGKIENPLTIALIAAELLTDVLVMRHPKAGLVEEVAQILDEFAPNISVINAGDNAREHPTQMLLDVLTIREVKQKTLKQGKLTVGLVGDLKDSRVFHSDAIGLSPWGVRFVLISPGGENLPDYVLEILERNKNPLKKTNDIREFASEIDVWIFTRFQRERKGEGDLSEQRKAYIDAFSLTPELRKLIKRRAIVLHPLPRLEEMPYSFDSDPRALYFSRQIKNGIYVRMAILEMLCS